jgi:uncharacterized protein
MTRICLGEGYRLLLPLTLMLASIIITACSSPESQRHSPQICHDATCWNLELAVTEQEHEKGLMYRKDLSLDAGMLFIFPEDDIYSFWMKNTWIPLDMIWLDSNMTVVYVKHDAQPCVAQACPGIDPGVSARYVLEINTGQAQREGIKAGDRLIYIDGQLP